MKVPETDRQADSKATDGRTTDKLVYGFSEDPGPENVLALCGGKGAGLMRMRLSGLPVPEGFVITTEACVSYIESGKLPDGLMAEVNDHMVRLEEETRRKFGDP